MKILADYIQRLAEAPKDGTLLKLLVNWPAGEWDPLEDAVSDDDAPWFPLENMRACWTIGFWNEFDAAWQIVGWSWCHDCFVDTKAPQVLAWTPFLTDDEKQAADLLDKMED